MFTGASALAFNHAKRLKSGEAGVPQHRHVGLNKNLAACVNIFVVLCCTHKKKEKFASFAFSVPMIQLPLLQFIENVSISKSPRA